MSEQNKALIRRWFQEVWNKGRPEAIDEMIAEDCIIHGLDKPSGEAVRGPDEFRAFHTQFREAFPTIDVKVEETLAEGDLVAARCLVTGKHSGDSLGFEATNAPIEFSGMVFARVKDGKIVEAWNNFDFMRMYTQIGVLK